ncbi:right-handed parallel beta-helix repeat-containing protein [Haloferula sp.]|uniref:right-handed parallel beta-helix repeat-containing protein n=1 Tax=Haloferula sp. TaxID=2497595 RepID=UPI003C70B1A2
MTLEDARKVLGLDADVDPADHVEDFNEARERIAALVRDAPNETIALRYQDGLLEFDKAMAAVREEMERRKGEKVANLMALVPGVISGRRNSNKRADFHKPVEVKKLVEEPKPVEEPKIEEDPKPKEEPQAEEAEPPNEEQAVESPFPHLKSRDTEEGPVLAQGAPKLPVVPPAKKITSSVERDEEEFEDDEIEDALESGSSSKGRFIAYAVIFLLIGGVGGGWIYTSLEAARMQRNQDRIIFLEGLGARLVESRRWSEAEEAYREIEERDPDSEVAERGMRSIEVGMSEEQTQFVGYWSGEALAALEAGRMDEAAAAAGKVLEKYPDEKEAAELLARIETERLQSLRQAWDEKIRAAVDERDWAVADAALASLSLELPEDPLVGELADVISEEKDQQQQDLAKARELVDAARLRDQGKFDPQALEWMREALALAPQDAEIKALYEKLASYSRTIRVPEEVKTLKEALSLARPKDRVLLGEGDFEGGMVINLEVQLEGAGADKTVLMMTAKDGPVLTLGPQAAGATISGLTLKHEGFDAGRSRYPVALVRGGKVEFSDCVFLEGSGHGLAVVEGGHATAQRCRFLTNGWDGAAASGPGSRLTIRESEATGNFGHGFEIWDGASAVIVDSKASRNSRNGVLVDAAGEGIEVSGGEFFGNREYGIVLNAGASGKVTGNSSYSNMMGGMLVRFSAISVVVEGNRIEKNSGPGLLLEQGLRAELYEGNSSRLNEGQEVMSNVRFQD